MKEWKTPMDINKEWREVAEIRCKKELESHFTLGVVYLACSHIRYLGSLEIIDDSGNLHSIAESKTQDWSSYEWFDKYFEVVKVL